MWRAEAMRQLREEEAATQVCVGLSRVRAEPVNLGLWSLKSEAGTGQGARGVETDRRDWR